MDRARKSKGSRGFIKREIVSGFLDGRRGRKQCQERFGQKNTPKKFLPLKTDFLGLCQYREALPRFPITQVATRQSKRPKRYTSFVSTLGWIEILLMPRSRTIYTRCHKESKTGSWHVLQTVRERQNKRKRRYFFCPRCCSAGAMMYYGGLGPRDLYCNHCIPLKSINSVINSSQAVATRRALAMRDYDSLGKLLLRGYKGLLGYRLAMDMAQNHTKYIPDLRSNDPRHRDLIKRVVYNDRLQCKTNGRLLYVDQSFIVRR